MSQRWNRWDCRNRNNYEKAVATHLAAAFLCTYEDVDLLLDRITSLWRNTANSIERNPMLWTIVVILVVLWLLGFLGHVGGGLIHLLLVIAVIIVIINLLQGRRGL
jgi:hypothetical protein